jgi:integrase
MRFSAYGERYELLAGYADEGITRERARARLDEILDRVRRREWRPPVRQPASREPDPLFKDFAERWFRGIEDDLSRGGKIDYLWQLNNHLIPFFGAHRLSEITIEEVDRYRRTKLAENPMPPRKRLNATSINKTITRLAQIMELAMEYHPDVVRANAARGRRRRLKSIRPRRTFLEPDEVVVVLKAAEQLDRKAQKRHVEPMGRRAIVSLLALAGPRAGELCALKIRDIDFANGLVKFSSKSDAGDREVPLVGRLHDELISYLLLARGDARPDEPAFVTRRGGMRDPHNLRRRVVDPVLVLANEMLESVSRPSLQSITPHSFRRTFISLMLAAGENPRDVMEWVGHADPGLTMSIYAQVLKRGPSTKQLARDLVSFGDNVGQPPKTGLTVVDGRRRAANKSA